MNPYFEQTIVNADPMELIRMIYSRTISSVREAREHLGQKRIAERSAAIMRAYAGVTELLCALRPAVAPELCGRLESLYHYILQRLLDANLQQSDHRLEEVLGLLTTLEEAWTGVARQLAADAEQTASALQAVIGMPMKTPEDGWLQTGAAYEKAGRLAISA